MIDGRRGHTDGEQVAAGGLRRQWQRVDLGRRLVRLGCNANVLTAMGVALSALFFIVVGLGHLWIGIGILVVGGLMDALDGLVAKTSGTASARGAFFDSVADRYSDALMYGGLGWYLLDSRHPKEAALPVAILAIGAIISYERAKAESLGFMAKGGLMERTERLIGLGIALLYRPTMVPVLWAVLVLTLGTAIGRFIRVWRQASGLPARIWIWKQAAPTEPEARLRWWQALAVDRRVAIRVDSGEHDHFGTRFRQRFSFDHRTFSGPGSIGATRWIPKVLRAHEPRDVATSARKKG